MTQVGVLQQGPRICIESLVPLVVFPLDGIQRLSVGHILRGGHQIAICVCIGVAAFHTLSCGLATALISGAIGMDLTMIRGFLGLPEVPERTMTSSIRVHVWNIHTAWEKHTGAVGRE